MQNQKRNQTTAASLSERHPFDAEAKVKALARAQPKTTRRAFQRADQTASDLSISLPLTRSLSLPLSLSLSLSISRNECTQSDIENNFNSKSLNTLEE